MLVFPELKNALSGPWVGIKVDIEKEWVALELWIVGKREKLSFHSSLSIPSA